MYNKECLNRWNMTEEQCDKAIRQIRVKGMRLTYEEKENLLWYIMEGYIKADDIDSQIAQVEDMRKDAEELKEMTRKVREFVKEWRRLEMKYDGFDYEDKSLDELTDMWMTNYFELYFLGEHYDAIEDIGGKNMLNIIATMSESAQSKKSQCGGIKSLSILFFLGGINDEEDECKDDKIL